MENNELVTDQLLNPEQPGNAPEDQVTETPVPQENNELSAETPESAPADEVIPPELLTEEQAKEVEKEMTEVEKLIAKRTGFWEVQMDLEDVKWIKNACQGKFEFTGPNEAYFLITCYMGFAGALQRAQNEKDNKVILQAAALEAAGMFINRYKGTTLEAAQRLFRIAMSMNNVILELRDLDAKIEMLRAAEKIANGEDPAPQPEIELKPVDQVESEA